MEIIKSKKEYDVIVVGSGAGGGMATKILSDAGISVALVESGPYFDPANPEQQTQLKWPWESPRRGAGTNRAFGDFHMSYGDWSLDGEPYSSVEGTDFRWWRSRMLGGRTNHWGRISLRFGPKDFKSKDFKNFAGYVYTTLQREIDAATNNKQKNKYILIRKQILRYIVTNERTITKELLNKK